MLSALRAQAAAARARRRDVSGTSFATWLAVGAGTPRAATSSPRLVLDDVHADLPGLSGGAAFALFVVDGRLDRLEGVTFGNERWPADVAGFTLHYDDEERDLGELDITDLVSLKEELSRITGCAWMGGPGSKG